MPFKSLCAVSYSPSIVTMAVSAAILEIFNSYVKDLQISIASCKNVFRFNAIWLNISKMAANTPKYRRHNL